MSSRAKHQVIDIAFTLISPASFEIRFKASIFILYDFDIINME